MGVVARSERDKYSGWPPPRKQEAPKAETEAPRKRRKVEKEADGDGA